MLPSHCSLQHTMIRRCARCQQVSGLERGVHSTAILSPDQTASALSVITSRSAEFKQATSAAPAPRCPPRLTPRSLPSFAPRSAGTIQRTSSDAMLRRFGQAQSFLLTGSCSGMILLDGGLFASAAPPPLRRLHSSANRGSSSSTSTVALPVAVAARRLLRCDCLPLAHTVRYCSQF